MAQFEEEEYFFELPYWSPLLRRHNLDVMHIEKNILGTLIEIQDKCKDRKNARLDMEYLGVWHNQHPVIEDDTYTLPSALYSLDKDDKRILCQFLQEVKMFDGFCSNLKRCVDDKTCKVSGLKTHDYHIILQKLLPLVIRRNVPEDVVMPLIELSRFCSALCSNKLVPTDLDKLASSIKETLCPLEMVFQPSFFDMMIHLPIDLAKEAKLGRPLCYRWMYPVERYLRTVEGHVRNKAQPEGSIAEAYIAEKCLTFCSRFFDIDTKLNRADHHEIQLSMSLLVV
jgi:hypothetical protein